MTIPDAAETRSKARSPTCTPMVLSARLPLCWSVHREAERSRSASSSMPIIGGMTIGNNSGSSSPQSSSKRYTRASLERQGSRLKGAISRLKGAFHGRLLALSGRDRFGDKADFSAKYTKRQGRLGRSSRILERRWVFFLDCSDCHVRWNVN